jgi:hypothetical protein
MGILGLPQIISPASRPGPPLHDLEVLDNDQVFTDSEDKLDYLWFHLVEQEDASVYNLHRVVRLKMLRYLPQEARQDAGLLDVMRSALTGLYNHLSWPKSTSVRDLPKISPVMAEYYIRSMTSGYAQPRSFIAFDDTTVLPEVNSDLLSRQNRQIIRP